MKRFLSTILALALIISLVPAVFAEDTATETEMEYSGITVKYGMVSGAGYTFTNNTVLSKDDKSGAAGVQFDDTNGFWEYHSKFVTSKTAGRDLKVQNSYCLNYNAFVGDWVAIEIDVPKAGKYDLTLTYGLMKTGSGAARQAGMWILPLINVDTGLEYTDEEITAALTEKTALSYSLNFQGDAERNKESSTESFSCSFAEKGTYLVVYKALKDTNGFLLGENEKDSDGNEGSNARMYPGTITLDGHGDAIPMAMNTAVVDDKTELQVDGTAQMTATVYMSDGAIATDDYKITYSSSDNNIAIVGANGLVTAKAYGKATITAVVDGYPEVSGLEEITVNAEGVSIDYNVGTHQKALKDAGGAYLTALTKDYTNGFYHFYGTSSETYDGSVSSGHLVSKTNGLQVNGAVAAVFEVYIPQKGTYTMEMWNSVRDDCRMAAVYLAKVEDISLEYRNEELGTKVGNYLCYANDSTLTLVTEPSIISGIQIEEPGWYALSFIGDKEVTDESWGSYIHVGNFTLTNGTGLTLPMPAIVKMDKTTLTLNDATNNTAIISGAVQCSSDGTVLAKSEDDVTTYASSDDSVVIVEDKKITAVGTGTAEITATIGNEVTAKRTVTVVDKEAGQTVSFAADGASAVYVKGQLQEEYTNLSLLSVNRGNKIKVIADTTDTNKTFRGWVRGSAESGRLVSNSAEYEFIAMTHTMLTAVYSDNTTAGDDVVEYYGWNKHYITTLPATADAPSAPTLTGYEFAKWVLGKSDDNIARKVAQYTAEKAEYEVTVSDGISKSVEGGKYIYDAKVTCTADEDVYWYRDNKLVDYGMTYSFYLWNNTSITTSSTGNNGAKIMLDAPKDKAYMIEYDKGTANVVEVGIIFGNSANITIDNCEEKMNSQRSDFTHGQFSATADEYTVARGYLIYNDNGTYRVIYAN